MSAMDSMVDPETLEAWTQSASMTPNLPSKWL